MEYKAEICYLKSNGTISNVGVVGMTRTSTTSFAYSSNSNSGSDKSIDVTITITKSDNNVFRIKFGNDTYATRYKINNVEYTNAKKELIIINPSNTLEIKLTKLNKENSSYSIESIDSNITIEYGKDSIQYITRGSQLKNDSDSPVYSPISQYGSIQIKDIDDVIVKLSSKGLLNKENVNVILKLNDNTSSNVIGYYNNINKLSYKWGNQLCDFELSDEISNYNSIAVDKINLKIDTFANLYIFLKSKTPNNDKFKELTTSQTTFLTNINTYYYTKESTSLFDLWTYFCNATKSTLYINESGEKELFLWQL